MILPASAGQSFRPMNDRQVSTLRSFSVNIAFCGGNHRPEAGVPADIASQKPGLPDTSRILMNAVGPCKGPLWLGDHHTEQLIVPVLEAGRGVHGIDGEAESPEMFFSASDRETAWCVVVAGERDMLDDRRKLH